MAEMAISKVGAAVLSVRGAFSSPLLLARILAECAKLYALIKYIQRNKIEPEMDREIDMKVIEIIRNIFKLCEEAGVSMDKEVIQDAVKEMDSLEKFWLDKEKIDGADGGTTA